MPFYSDSDSSSDSDINIHLTNNNTDNVAKRSLDTSITTHSMENKDSTFTKNIAKPLYFIDITSETVADFELMNSMYTLQSYDTLLFYLENDIIPNQSALNQASWKFVVPSFDMINVLFTLAFMSSNYKGKYLTKNNPFNVSNRDLQTRSLNLLSKYLSILDESTNKSHSTSNYTEYQVSVLRCQFFLFIDNLFDLNSAFMKNNNDNVSFKLTKFDNSSFSILDRLKIPSNLNYTQLTTSLNKLKKLNSKLYPFIVSPFQNNSASSLMVFNSLIFPLQFQKENFWDYLGETLSNLTSLNNAEFCAGLESSFVFSCLLRVIKIRQDYYIENELSKEKNVSKNIKLQQLKDSPLCKLFSLFDKRYPLGIPQLLFPYALDSDTKKKNLENFSSKGKNINRDSQGPGFVPLYDDQVFNVDINLKLNSNLKNIGYQTKFKQQEKLYLATNFSKQIILLLYELFQQLKVFVNGNSSSITNLSLTGRVTRNSSNFAYTKKEFQLQLVKYLIREFKTNHFEAFFHLDFVDILEENNRLLEFLWDIGWLTINHIRNIDDDFVLPRLTNKENHKLKSKFELKEISGAFYEVIKTTYQESFEMEFEICLQCILRIYFIYLNKTFFNNNDELRSFKKKFNISMEKYLTYRDQSYNTDIKGKIMKFIKNI
ncbi:Smc5-Smc6 complex subunit NSE5 SCDLUD_003337 [Saccharomycodes ludwigii]|uniref:Smc5-Smc6 complex subunit NSE5 n=1 Tax=Saccharomycodes ludwigii TaxID=36035 RepID=UPI001E8496DB|nr:hypothetical protein SCDLUD_003337 [Saccharomycodes ludwigii]KAH3900363.1 hypothetical protein SCDLUD_003337 [Saccharomycodes ludwigii]